MDIRESVRNLIGDLMMAICEKDGLIKKQADEIKRLNDEISKLKAMTDQSKHDDE